MQERRAISFTMPAAVFLLGSILAAQGESDAAARAAQAARAGRAARAGQVTDRYIVLFKDRSFDLSTYREAILARRPATEVARIVADLEAAKIRDQAGFVDFVRGVQGGLVHQQWWLINGLCCSIPPAGLERVRAHPRVLDLVPDRLRAPQLVVATDSKHHASDQANQMQNEKGRLIIGTGVAIGILDSGADANMGTSGRPHRAYYPGGDPKNNGNAGIKGSLLLAALSVNNFPTEDTVGHGTSVFGCAAANKWDSGLLTDNGFAPGSGVVSVNIADSSGLSVDSWLIAGWQQVVSVRAQHGIGAANNSYSGPPEVNAPLGQALDSAAYNADLLITVSAGNAGSNTMESQHAFNGIAVGSIDKQYLSRSSTSALGPLYKTSRTYPDIMAVGDSVHSVPIDTENGTRLGSGTSLAAPMVTGTAALLRQANPKLNAMQVKALLLNTTKVAGADRNQYGLGILRADTATTSALAGDVALGLVSTTRPVANFDFQAPANSWLSITATWMRQQFSSLQSPNLDLRIYDSGNGLVGQDLNPANSYEKVRAFVATAGSYRAEIRWANAGTGGTSIPFAIAGVATQTKPQLSKLTPGTVSSYLPAEVTITGSSLALTTSVMMGSVEVPAFTVIDDRELRFQPIGPHPIGPVPITVVNGSGTSNALLLTVAGRSDPVLVGSPTAQRGQSYEYQVHSGKNWLSLLLVSDSSQPSRLSGVYELGIGSGFTRLWPLVYLRQGPDGSSKVQLPYPTSLPTIMAYYQAMSVDIQSPSLPYPASNILQVWIY